MKKVIQIMTMLTLVMVMGSAKSQVQKSLLIPPETSIKVAIINHNLESKEIIQKSLEGFIIFEAKSVDKIGNIISEIGAKTEGKKINELLIFSHGKEGSFQLGDIEVNSKALQSDPDYFYFFNLLADNAKIFSFSCYSGNGSAGLELIKAIEKLTKAQVYLSDNKTGVNGDWVFEVSNSNQIAVPSLDLNYLKKNYKHSLQVLSETGFTLTNMAAMPVNMAGMAIDKATGNIFWLPQVLQVVFIRLLRQER